jgi:hypothetical protein
MENLGKGAADTAGTASDEDGVASETHRSFPLQDVLRIVSSRLMGKRRCFSFQV